MPDKQTNAEWQAERNLVIKDDFEFYRKTWNRMSLRWRAIQYSLLILNVAAGSYITVRAQTEGAKDIIPIVSLVSLISVALFSGLSPALKAHCTRAAWRVLNAAIMEFRLASGPIRPSQIKRLIEAYERGEAIIENSGTDTANSGGLKLSPQVAAYLDREELDPTAARRVGT